MVPEGYTWFFVQNATQEVDKLLYEELAWRDPDAEFTDSYKRGDWDGYNHLYKKSNHMAPIGLLDRATDVLKKNGYNVSTTFKGDSSGDPITTDWNFPHPLRDYQHDAISSALKNDGGIISLPTGAGKTVIAMSLINALEQRSIVFVHTQELLYQWENRIEETLDVDVGLIGDGCWNESEVTIAMMQTVNERGTEMISENYGIAVFDEAHITSAAETMRAVGLDIDVKWRFGLSATPWRSASGEEMEIEATVGAPAAVVGAQQLIDQGYLAEPKFEFIQPSNPNVGKQHESYHDVMKRCLEFAPNRNMAIAEKAEDLASDGYTVLITVNRIDQGKLLEYALNPKIGLDTVLEEISEDGDGANEARMKANAVEEMDQIGTNSVEFLQGSDTTATRQETLDEFKHGNLDILVTTVLKEGADIPSISAIVLAEGGKSKVQKIQRIGRALRQKEDNHAVIADVADRGPYLEDHYETRRRNYREYYGEYGPDDGRTEREKAVGKFLEKNGIPLTSCQVQETNTGAVTIKLTDYLGDKFTHYRNLVHQTQGISYDGSKNICDPDWIRQLSE
jgi:superfamily II DNA or RNA helicase